MLVSPRFSKSKEAIFLKILRIIFPLRVLGSAGAHCMKSGLAMGLISLATISLSSVISVFVGVTVAFKVTKA